MTHLSRDAEGDSSCIDSDAATMTCSASSAIDCHRTHHRHHPHQYQSVMILITLIIIIFIVVVFITSIMIDLKSYRTEKKRTEPSRTEPNAVLHYRNLFRLHILHEGTSNSQFSRSKYHAQLAKMVFDEILDLKADCCFFHFH